jgi:hypothetical protein
MNTLSASSSDEQFRRRFSLAEEDRRDSANPPMWNGSDRWFQSAGVIDLWRYRSSEEKKRIVDFAWSCWRRANGGVPVWPPPTASALAQMSPRRRP